MASPFKDLLNEQFFEEFCNTIDIPYKKYFNQLFDKEWERRELKDRMKHAAACMHEFMPQPFDKAADWLVEKCQVIEESPLKSKVLEIMFLPDYIELYGLETPLKSLETMKEVTKLTTCEFVVRPFILKYEKQVMAKMLEWSTDEHVNVRRFSSEGCRPRLPWGASIPRFKKDPSPILPILENLKNDQEEFVKKSVANNLNDITKDNPEIAIKIFKKWYGDNDGTNWIVKHASRTLLKEAHPEMMNLFGYSDPKDVKTSSFQIQNTKVEIGGALSFQFELEVLSKKEANVRLEYAVYYLLANGKHSKKVFKISEKMMSPATKQIINRNQSFKVITTRKFYAGNHYVSLIINGEERDKAIFELV